MPAGRGAPFRYGSYELDPAAGHLVCHYSVGDRHFSEEIEVELAGSDPSRRAPGPALQAAARLVHLLAGVSYYKTTAAATVELGGLATTADERRFLRTFYVEGLGEFAYRNGLDLSALEVTGPDAPASPVAWAPDRERPLVPFGGGIDSIVTVQAVRESHPGLSLFVVSRAGDRFAAIEEAAAVTGLPVVRAQRRIDPALLASAELGFLNGHVPVTGILSAIAVLAAAFTGHGTVVMSNERSASAGNLEVGGRTVNHQWSKGAEFEERFRRRLSDSFAPGPDYFSFLRGRSELWVARRFAGAGDFHRAFRSCNRAFAQEPARRLDHWCGKCDKCCFVDLVLSPYLDPGTLAAVFDGAEPLADPGLADRFRVLLGTGEGPKPFDCVGDVAECRAALAAAAARPDRSGTVLLQTLVAELPDPAGALASAGTLADELGPDNLAPSYRTTAT